MHVVVMKFGGTSVNTPERREEAARRVQATLESGRWPVVVVSAMGRRGEPYATDSLLDLVGRDGVMPARDLDLLASCGEIISAVVMSYHLRQLGLEPVPLTGWQAGIITDDTFGNAIITRVDTSRLTRHLENKRIPVITGFQGMTPDGEIATLGRGGSDTTAAAVGAALHAEVVEIYTDVDGVKTADPRLVPEARTIDEVAYSEIWQMAHAGAKVVHPRAVEIAMAESIPVRVLDTTGKGAGTLITAHPNNGTGVFSEQRLRRPVTAVTYLGGVAQLRVRAPGDQERSLEVFDSLAQAGISVDLINVSENGQMFTVSQGVAERAEKILAGLGFSVEVVPDCAKVSVVGLGMRGVPGVMAKVVRALHGAGVPILQTSDSHLTISCLVPGNLVKAAVQALHSEFQLGQG